MPVASMILPFFTYKSVAQRLKLIPLQKLTSDMVSNEAEALNCMDVGRDVHFLQQSSIHHSPSSKNGQGLISSWQSSGMERTLWFRIITKKDFRLPLLRAVVSTQGSACLLSAPFAVTQPARGHSPESLPWLSRPEQLMSWSFFSFPSRNWVHTHISSQVLVRQLREQCDKRVWKADSPGRFQVSEQH